MSLYRTIHNNNKTLAASVLWGTDSTRLQAAIPFTNKSDVQKNISNSPVLDILYSPSNGTKGMKCHL